MWNEWLGYLVQHGWIIKSFFIISSAGILSYVASRIYKRLYPRLQKTRTIWDDVLLYALHPPLRGIIWTIGLSFAAQVVGTALQEPVVTNLLPQARAITITVLGCWFFLRFITCAEKRIWEKKAREKEIDQTTLHAICQILRAAVVVTAGLVGLQSMGVSISGVIAFGGVGGLIIGFAAKDLLANFFGGLMIFLDRPFKVGDWIRSPDKEIEGTVEHIGWRLTRIRTFAKRPLYVPNGIFSTISVENPSRMTNRRIYTNVGLRYDDASQINTILAAVEAMLREHPEIDTGQTLMVNLVEFGASSLNFMIYTFTKTTDWVRYQAIQQDVFLKTIEIIERHGAQCAFPTTTLHIPESINLHPRSVTPLSASTVTR